MNDPWICRKCGQVNLGEDSCSKCNPAKDCNHPLICTSYKEGVFHCSWCSDLARIKELEEYIDLLRQKNRTTREEWIALCSQAKLLNTARASHQNENGWVSIDEAPLDYHANEVLDFIDIGVIANDPSELARAREMCVTLVERLRREHGAI